jgi:hypothetical protein
MFGTLLSTDSFVTVLHGLLTAVLSNPADVLVWIRELIRYAFRLMPKQGMYEVLEHHAQLELCDPSGHLAVYSKKQRVRFLQDNIIAYQDQAWGDGDIFADYQCSPGVPVDRYREGQRYRILISLRGTKKRGDIEEFLIQRTIKNGFTHPVEDLQTDIDHVTRLLTVTLVFPKTRPAREVRLIEKHAERSHVLGAETTRSLPDGRRQVMWRCTNPKRFEAYLLRWQW